MKKSLIALAALATVATAAQAQSSVTIYGVMDMGFGSVTGVGSSDQRISGIQNGGLSTSRIGFKGTEDLGGGMSAGFTLETEILGDTGEQGKSPAVLFERGAFVTLGSASLGSISLGRQNYDEYATGAAFDPFGGNNIGGWIAQAQYGSARFNNGITVKTASFNGFGLTYQHVFGEVAGDTSKGSAYSIGANYAAGAFAAAAITSRSNDATTGNKTGQNTSVYAKYNAGFADFRAGYVGLKTYHASTGATTKDQKGYFVGAVVPVNANVNVLAIATQYKDFGGVDNNRDPKGYALGATYSLSKRTTLYAITAKSSQDNSSALNVVSTSKWGSATNATAPGDGKDQTAYTVGIRHTF